MNDAKAMVAALELIFTSSARYGVSAADLSSELQQLGLPREHSTAVARLHTDHCSQITAVLSSQSLRGDQSINSKSKLRDKNLKNVTQYQPLILGI